MEEYLDLYDRSGQPLHRVLRRGDAAPEGAFWRVCDIWLMNAAGKLLIQRRADSRPTHPGKWACTGGAIQHGESGEAGCLREAQEELGVRLDLRRGHMLFEYVSSHSIHAVWLFFQDIPLSKLRLQAEEVADARYASMDDICRMARQGSFVPFGYLRQLAQMLPLLRQAYGKEDAEC